MALSVTFCVCVCVWATLWVRPPPEVQKVRQLGNLVARNFLKNQTLAESFWILFPHFLVIEQFGGSLKEKIAAFLQNGLIFIHVLQYPKKAINSSLMFYQGTFIINEFVIL